jgi:hypothetical protein
MAQFSLMHGRPFNHKPQCTARKTTGKNRQRVDIDPRFIIAIEPVKMRRVVIVLNIRMIMP